MNEFNLDRRTVLKLAGTTALAGGAVSLSSSTALANDFSGLIEVEGPISSIVDNGDGTGVINAMGMALAVDLGVEGNPDRPRVTTLTSPSGANLSLDQISSTPEAPSLPGRSDPGFVGGTVKGAGTITHLDPPALALTDAILEPAENVVFGAVTATDDASNTIDINGLTVIPITDPRMEFPGYFDAAGAELTPSQIDIGTLAAAEGYYSTTENALFVFIVELDFVAGGTAASVAIQRAEYRPDKGEFRADGAASDPDGRVWIANTAGTRIEAIAPVPVEAADSTWRVDVEQEGLEIPEQVVAQLESFVDGSWTQVAQSDPFTVTIDD